MYNDFIEKHARDLSSYNTILSEEFQDNLTKKFEKFIQDANKYANDSIVGPALGSHIDEYRAIHDSILHTYSILTRAAKNADDLSLTTGTNASMKMQSRADEICAKVRYINREIGKWEDVYEKINIINSRDESKELFEDYVSKETFLSNEYLNAIFAEEDVNKSLDNLSGTIDMMRNNPDIAILREESPISAPMLDQIINETEAIERDLIQSKINTNTAIDKMQETHDRYRVNYFTAITNIAKYGMASLSGSTLTLAQNLYHKASDALSSVYKSSATVYHKIDRAAQITGVRTCLLMDEYLNIASHGLYAKAHIALLKSPETFKEIFANPKERYKKTAEAIKDFIDAKIFDEYKIVFEYPTSQNDTLNAKTDDMFKDSDVLKPSYDENSSLSYFKNSTNIKYWENLDNIFEQKVEKPLDDIVNDMEGKLKAAGKTIKDKTNSIVKAADQKFDEIILYPCFDRLDKTDNLLKKMTTAILDAKTASTELLAKTTEAIVKLDNYYYSRMTPKAKALHDADKKLHEKKEAINQVISALDDNIITPYVPKDYTESEEFTTILDGIKNVQGMSEKEIDDLTNQVKTSINDLKLQTEVSNLTGQFKSDIQPLQRLYKKAELATTDAISKAAETYSKAFDTYKGIVVNNIKLKEDMAKSLHNEALKSSMKAEARKEDMAKENNIELD